MSDHERWKLDGVRVVRGPSATDAGHKLARGDFIYVLVYVPLKEINFNY